MSQDLTRQIVAAIEAPSLLFDGDWRVVAENRAAVKCLGASTVQRTLAAIFDIEAGFSEPLPDTAEAGTVHWRRVRSRMRDNHSFRIKLSWLSCGVLITIHEEMVRGGGEVGPRLANAIAFTDTNGTITGCNAEFRALFDLSAGTRLGNLLGRVSLVGEEGGSHHAMQPSEVQQGRARARICCEGACSEFEVDISPLSGPDGENSGLICEIIDDNWERQLRARLRVAEERFRWLTETIDDFIYMIDPATGQMSYVSPAYEKVWGRSCESLYADASSALAAIIPEDREAVMDALPIQESQSEFRRDYRIARPDGSIRWLRDRGFVLRNSAGKIQHFIGIATDVTEQMESQKSIAEAQRLEAVGQLTGELAHDFNNLLTIIRLNASNLIEGQTLPVGAVAVLEKIVSTANRGAEVTRALLAVARRQALETEVCDTMDVLNANQQILQMALGNSSRLEISPCMEKLPIRIDRATFSNILLNLAINARDAMHGSGTFTLTAKSVYLKGKEPFAVAADLAAGRYLFLDATDTGDGMEPSVLARAFEPFFTTKEQGFGSGLGLAILYGFARQSGGTAIIESTLGKGTTVRLVLPIIAGDTAANEDDDRVAIPHVLLVDDEPDLRDALALYLQRRGFRVTQADDAKAALKLLAADSFEVMISDVAMKEIGGVELAYKAVELRPALRIILASGFAANLSSEGLPWPVLDKTSLHEKLITVLHQELGDSGPTSAGAPSAGACKTPSQLLEQV